MYQPELFPTQLSSIELKSYISVWLRVNCIEEYQITITPSYEQKLKIQLKEHLENSNYSYQSDDFEPAYATAWISHLNQRIKEQGLNGFKINQPVWNSQKPQIGIVIDIDLNALIRIQWYNNTIQYSILELAALMITPVTVVKLGNNIKYELSTDQHYF